MSITLLFPSFPTIHHEDMCGEEGRGTHICARPGGCATLSQVVLGICLDIVVIALATLSVSLSLSRLD